MVGKANSVIDASLLHPGHREEESVIDVTACH